MIAALADRLVGSSELLPFPVFPPPAGLAAMILEVALGNRHAPTCHPAS